MSANIDAKAYKANYEKTLLAEALNSAALRTKTTLLVFSSLLLVVSAYDLQLKTIPGLSLDIPSESANPLKGMLSLACLYMLVQFYMYFFLDYGRWRMQQEIANVAHSEQAFRDLKDRIKEIENRINYLAPYANNNFPSNIIQSLKNLDGVHTRIDRVRRGHKLLWVLQLSRFWVIDVIVPFLVTVVAVLLSGNAAIELLKVVFVALFDL